LTDEHSLFLKWVGGAKKSAAKLSSVHSFFPATLLHFVLAHFALALAQNTLTGVLDVRNGRTRRCNGSGGSGHINRIGIVTCINGTIPVGAGRVGVIDHRRQARIGAAQASHQAKIDRGWKEKMSLVRFV
jgi:hypothetical protein